MIASLSARRWFPLLLAVVAAGAAIVASLLLIATTGTSPFSAAKALWDGSFGSRQQAATTVARALPMILVALGWIVASSAGRLNVGFGGQMIMAAVGSALCAQTLPESMPRAVLLPACVIAGVAFGAGHALIAAALWAWRGVNEVILTLLLEFIAIQVLVWLVNGPMQDPTSSVARSSPLPESARWPNLVDRTPLNWDVFLVAAMVGLVWFIMRRTTTGFRLRVTGANEAAARANGLRTTLISVSALATSGAIAGLAGSGLLLGGESPYLTDRFSSVASIGLTGIVVALLALNAPIATIPAALLMASLQQGGGLMEARLGTPHEALIVTEALVLLAIASSVLMLRLLRTRRVDSVMTPSAGVGASPTEPRTSIAAPAGSAG